MSKVVHFEINTPDVEKTTAFYGGVFGWQFQKWEGPEPYWLVTTGEQDAPGIGGGMMSVKDWPQTVNIVGVDSMGLYRKNHPTRRRVGCGEDGHSRRGLFGLFQRPQRNFLRHLRGG